MKSASMKSILEFTPKKVGKNNNNNNKQENRMPRASSDTFLHSRVKAELQFSILPATVFIYRFTYLAIASKVSIENIGSKAGIVTAEYSKLYYGTVVLQIAVNNVINVKRK